MFPLYFSVKTAISDTKKFDLHAFFAGDAIFNSNVTSDFVTLYNVKLIINAQHNLLDLSNPLFNSGLES